MEMSKKLCGGCMQLKDYSEFQKSYTRRAGLQSMCRECRNRRDRERYRERRATGTLELFSTDEANTAGFPLSTLTRGEADTVSLPCAPSPPATGEERKRRSRCHRQVRKAIEMGSLVRPQRCSVCGRSRDEVGRLYAHHEDYTRPLSVVFLCPSCHAIVHRQIRRRRTYEHMSSQVVLGKVRCSNRISGSIAEVEP